MAREQGVVSPAGTASLTGSAGVWELVPSQGPDRGRGSMVLCPRDDPEETGKMERWLRLPGGEEALKL